MVADLFRGTLPAWRLAGLAFRNIGRSRARSVLMLASIAVGVAGLMLSGGFVKDLLFRLGEAVIHSQSGHIQVGRTGYFQSGSRSPGKFLVSPEQIAKVQVPLPHVRETMRRVAFTGLINNGRSAYPIVGEGIEADKEAKLGTYMDLLQGRALTPSDRYGALVGAGVAKAMGLKPGMMINIVAPTVDESMNTLEFEVVGVFQSFSKDYDDRIVKVPLSTAQELLDTQGVNTVVVLLDQTQHTGTIMDALGKQLDGLGLELRRWEQLNEFYEKSVALYDRQFGVLRLIVLLMVILAVAGAINMAVLERAGEFGTMRALGNRSGDVLRLVLLEGVFIGTLGALLGVVLGWGAAELLSAVGIPMPPPPNSNVEFIARIRLSPLLFVGSALIGFFAAVVASLPPAFRVARLPVVEALRQLV